MPTNSVTTTETVRPDGSRVVTEESIDAHGNIRVSMVEFPAAVTVTTAAVTSEATGQAAGAGTDAIEVSKVPVAVAVPSKEESPEVGKMKVEIVFIDGSEAETPPLRDARKWANEHKKHLIGGGFVLVFAMVAIAVGISMSNKDNPATDSMAPASTAAGFDWVYTALDGGYKPEGSSECQVNGAATICADIEELADMTNFDLCYDQDNEGSTCSLWLHDSNGTSHCCGSCSICPEGCKTHFSFDCKDYGEGFVNGCECPVPSPEESAGRGNSCSVNADYINQAGSYDCFCKDGYLGDGLNCVDANECVGEGSGNTCSLNADCTNIPGSFDCSCKKGYFGNPFDSECNPIMVKLTSPSHGHFSQGTIINVEGLVTMEPLEEVNLTINGAPVSVEENGVFSTSVPLDAAITFNEVKAMVTHTLTGFETRDRVVVIVGQSVPFGGIVPESFGLRITNSGFDALEQVIKSVVDLSLSDLIPRGTKLINNKCFADCLLFCCTEGDVTVGASSNNGFDINLGPRAISVTMNNIRIDLKVDTNTIDCNLRITIDTAVASGVIKLEADPSDPMGIDVNQLSNVKVDFTRFNHEFTNGFCDFISPILDILIGDIESQARDGLEEFLRGAALSMKIEDALEQLEITGPIFSEFGVNASTPLFEVTEDEDGITLASNTIMTTLEPHPASPTFSQTLFLPQAFPFMQLSSVTPGGFSYDVALVISDSVFNQVLAAQVESGIFDSEIEELPFGNSDPVPISAGLLGALVAPEFNQLPQTLALKIRIMLTLAPVMTGNTGPMGEIAEVSVSHLLIDVVSGETLHARIAIDTTMVIDFEIDGITGDITPQIMLQDAADVHVTLLDNPLGINEGSMQQKLVQYIPLLIPQLPAFSTFSLPGFLGLQLTAAEISRAGDFLGIFLSIA